MKKILLILLACLPLFAIAKDNKEKNNSDPKYLAGALTYEDGKITFTREINAPGLSKDEIYQRMLDWANERFQPEDGMQSRVVYTNKEDGDIAASAEEWMVFSSTALSLDRTRVYYQLTAKAGDGQCLLTMSRIRYWYDENRDGGEKYTAEEWITDDMALNKKKTKLAPICGKFRRETIDLKDQLFQSATDALGQKVLANETAPAVVPATPLTPAMTLTGELKEVPVAQFSDNWNSQLQNGRITLTANDEEIEIKAENWGGFGKLFNKNVAYLLIAQDRIALSALMEQCSEYKISFYAQGASQPTAVIECKKSMSQKMTAEDLKSLNIQADSNKSYTMYTGEITRTQLRQ
mgnify:FL=1